MVFFFIQMSMQDPVKIRNNFIELLILETRYNDIEDRIFGKPLEEHPERSLVRIPVKPETDARNAVFTGLVRLLSHLSPFSVLP